MKFKYRAYKNNRIVSAKIDAEDEKGAINYLKDNGYFLISLDNADGLRVSEMFSYLLFSSHDVINFTRQLAIMTNAGLNVVQSLDILKKQTTSVTFRDVVIDIDKQVRGGNTISSALRKYPRYFSRLYIALVRAGEATGKFGDIMSKLANNLEKAREIKNKVKGALVYPITVVVVMVVVMIIMTMFVMPKLLELYREFDVELPLTTQALMFMSYAMINFWPIILLAFVGTVGAIRAYLATVPGRHMLDSTLIRTPVLGDLIKTASLVDMSRTLSILIGSGVSILEALEIVVETTNNTLFQDALKRIHIAVEKGRSLGDSFASEHIFPPILVQMITIGETTGKLDEALFRISNYFEDETELATKALTTIIEPLILIVLGIGVGIMIFSIITPIYNLTASFN